MSIDDLTALPGGDLVITGLRDLRAGVDSVEAALVQVGASNLRACGIDVPAGATTGSRLRAFMRALAREARAPLQVYLVGGSTAVLEGWRDATIDMELYRFPAIDPASFRRAVLQGTGG